MIRKISVILLMFFNIFFLYFCISCSNDKPLVVRECVKKSTPVDTVIKEPMDSPYTITNRKYMKQPYDIFSIKEMCGSNIEDLINEDYKSISIYIYMEISEIKDGKQIFYILPDEKTEDYYATLTLEKDDLLQETPSKCTFFFQMPIEMFTSNDICIRYGTDFWGSEWVNNYISIVVTPNPIAVSRINFLQV